MALCRGSIRMPDIWRLAWLICIQESKLTAIGIQAFAHCSSLESITIPDSVTFINYEAFWRCYSLTSVTIGNSVTTIASDAFSQCHNLASVTFSKDSQLTTIGSQAFADCRSLASITIPDSVTYIGSSVFEYCDALPIQVENGVSYIGKWVIGCDTSVTTIILREDTVGIAGGSFGYCSSLTSVTIPNSVTILCRYAFYRSSITSITIPDSVTSIDYRVFYDCTSLTTITFDGTVEEWNAITLGESWNYNIPATEVICSNGVVSLN